MRRVLLTLSLVAACVDSDAVVDKASEECREIVESAVDQCEEAAKDLQAEIAAEIQSECLDKIDSVVTDALTALGCRPSKTNAAGWRCPEEVCLP